MPHYLVLIPALDYELFHDSKPDLSNSIIPATSPSEAILTRLNKENDPDYEYDIDMAKSAVVLELARPGVFCAKQPLLESLCKAEENRKQEKQKAAEIAELKRLVAKYGKEVL